MNQYGISSVAMFMLGAPTETEQTIRNTARFARELGATYVIARILYPYPGTEAYCDLYEHKMFKIRDWNEIRNPRKEDVTISHPNLATNELSLPHITFKKIIALQSELHILFYCDPKYMLRTILKIRNWSMLKKYISLLSGIVRFWLRYGLR
jgi:radical SAM superfamily enzyme YgiQ (UPF0313 family)